MNTSNKNTKLETLAEAVSIFKEMGAVSVMAQGYVESDSKHSFIFQAWMFSFYNENNLELGYWSYSTKNIQQHPFPINSTITTKTCSKNEFIQVYPIDKIPNFS